ncbi:MAG: ABC transporter permease [Clostridiales bacterium]|nr:ABC transporter permease [Clostridiales bacterium]
MEKTKKRSFDINTWLPIIFFVLIAVIFGIGTKGTLFTAINLQSIFNQSVATIIAALGMLFVASMGGTDITTGVVVALGGCFGLMAATATGASVMFIIVSILIGIGSGLLLGWANVKRKVNSFMASLALLIAYRAVVNLMLSNNVYYLPDNLYVLNSFAFKVIAVVVLVIVIVYIFHFTPFGSYVRAIGENEVAVQHIGVNVDRIKIMAFVISGIMAAIAGIFTVARLGGTNNTIGSGFEMKVMMALFISGIPVQGGFGSKVYKVLFGAPTIIMLENGLVLMGASGGLTQLVRGLVLIGAVALTGFIGRKFANVGVEEAHNQKFDLPDDSGTAPEAQA